jgi:hypothetical protein
VLDLARALAHCTHAADARQRQGAGARVKGSNVSVTLDLLVLLVLLVLLTRGAGRAWLATLFTYHPVKLDLVPKVSLFGGGGGSSSASSGGFDPTIPSTPLDGGTSGGD